VEALEAIQTRRSIGKVRPDPLPRALVARLVETVALAPNHHLTEPWRLFVLAGAAREALGEVMAEALRARLGDAPRDAAQVEALLAVERAKPLRAPVVIAVAARHQQHPKALEVEDLAAVAAGVQNLLLGAHALGLGAYWRTGDAAYDPRVKAFFGLGEPDHLVGFVYLGYPAEPPKPVTRTPAAELIEWRGWE